MWKCAWLAIVAGCSGDVPSDEAAAGGDLTTTTENVWAQAGSGWTNRPLPIHDGAWISAYFTARVTSPSGLVDAVIGFSRSAAGNFTDLGPIVRFNPNGTVDARDGGGYRDSGYRYATYTDYRIGFVIDLDTHRYTASIRGPDDGDFVPLGTDLAFRSEQATLSRVANIAGIIDSSTGTLSTSDMLVYPDICATASPGWAGMAFGDPQSGALVGAQFDAMATAPTGSSTVDAVAGLAAAQAHGFADLAAIVRFNPDGYLDARDGDTYRASAAVPYTPGNWYRFQFFIDHAHHYYQAFVSPTYDETAPQIELAHAFAFRTEQTAIATFANVSSFVDSAGALETCNAIAWRD